MLCFMRRFSFTLFLFTCGWINTQSKLLTLISISRHGSRAPNPSAKHLCPNNLPNLDSYPVPLSQLTPNGMEEMESVGSKIRNTYVNELKFLSPSINGMNPSNRSTFESYFRSDSADRCAQSAVAFGYGLYPDTSAPKGYHRQPLALTMNEWSHEYVFQIPHLACQNVFKQDADFYAKNQGKILFQQHHQLLEEIKEVCGISLKRSSKDTEEMINNLKDIADMMEFDAYQKLPPLKGLKPNVQKEIQSLAYEMLMERFYSTEQMITYWAGGMPNLLIQHLQNGVLENIGRTAYVDRVSEFHFDQLMKQTQSLAVSKAKNSHKQPYKYYSYHGHREMLYAMAMLFQWEFVFPNEPRAMEESSIPPATTMLFELHSENGQFHIETYIVSPEVDRTSVKLKKCSSEKCPLHEFLRIINNHMHKTGTWEEICNTKTSSSVNLNELQSSNANFQSQELKIEGMKPVLQNPVLETSDNVQRSWMPSPLFLVQMIIGICFGVFIGAIVMFNAIRFRRRQGYRVL